MTEEEFAVIRAELERLSNGLTKAVRQIVEQEAQITALESILEQEGLMSREDFRVARDRAFRSLLNWLDWPSKREP